MKENEFHELNIETEFFYASASYSAVAHCPICHSWICTKYGKSKEDAIRNAKDFCGDYCYNCGVRLKEVKE